MTAMAAGSVNTRGVAVLEAIVVVSVVHYVVEIVASVVLDRFAAVHKEETGIVVF